MISASMLSRSFDGVPAVEDLTFEIPEGKLFTLLGPNGAGKTTTIRLLLGLIAADRGSAEVAGYPIGRDPQTNSLIRASSGLLTETPGFYDRLSARKNLLFYASLYRIPAKEREARLEHYLRMMDLWERRNDPVGGFSKGMKQKLAIIRAIFHEPEVIFLDEPTAGLDPEASLMVREMIAKLKGEGRTIVLCTHNLDEAERLSDIVGIIKRRLLVCAPLDELQRESGERQRVEIELANADEKFARLLGERSSIARLEVNHRSYTIEVIDPAREVPEIVRALVSEGAGIRAVIPQRRDLHTVYLECVREEEEGVE